MTIGARSSVWCNATLRGDVNRIEIGEETNIQDNCCLHVDGDKPLRLGDRVVVGHSVTLHACVVEDEAQIGMGATVLSGARVGKGSIVGAGSLVVEGAENTTELCGNGVCLLRCGEPPGTRSERASGGELKATSS